MNNKIFKLIFLVILFVINNNNVFAIDVKLDSVSINSKSKNVTANYAKINNKEITTDIIFKEVGDYVVYKLYLKSNDNNKYKIKTISDDNDNKYIKTSYKYESTIESPVYLTIKYDKELQGKLELNNINITISLINESGKEEITTMTTDVKKDNNSFMNTIENNPQTGIILSIILPIVALALSIISMKLYTDKTSKILIILLPIILLIPITVIAEKIEKLNLTINTKNISIYKEADTEIPQNNDSTQSEEITNDNHTDTQPATQTKILLIAGHAYEPYCEYIPNSCRGKEVSGYDETVETRSFVQVIKNKLIEQGYPSSNIDIANELLGEDFNDPSTTKTLYIEIMKKQNGDSNTLSNINFSDYKYAIELHFNSSENHTTKGIATVCPSKNDCGLATTINYDIRKDISQILGSQNFNVYPRSTKTFNFFRELGIPFTYLETEFYDNKSAMDNFTSKKNEVAESIAKNIKKYYP